MDDDGNEVSAPSNHSFYECAAWISLLTPIATVAITALHLYFQHGISRNPQSSDFIFAIFTNVVGLILGIASLIGWRHHRRRLTVWTATFGIMASSVVGFAALFFCALSAAMGRNC
jgi:hypothetical protein